MTSAAALAGPTRAIEHAFVGINDALARPVTAERFEALSIGVSNLSHLLAYLDGNAIFIDVRPLTNLIRDALEADAFQLRCADWLSAAPPGAVDSVLAGHWLDWIAERQDPDARAARDEVDAALAELDVAVRGGEAKLLALLHRLGAQTGDFGGNTAFTAIMSSVADPGTRMRLSRARALVGAETAAALQARLDRVVAARFDAGAPLAPTLLGGSLGLNALDSFIDSALRSAGAMRQALIDRLAPADEDETALASAFPRYLSQYFASAAGLKLPLAPGLDMLGEIAGRALGLRITRSHGEFSPIEVWQAERRLGTIELDCLNTPRTVALQHGESSPRARILCRLNGSEVPTLSFDAMRMVFHEFGHALAHTLLQVRKPSFSGLDHSPLERLELLSTWFEHWIFHPDIAERLSLAPEDRAALATARVAKLLEAQRSMAARAICARLDLDLHRASGLNAQAAWGATLPRLPGLAPDASDVWADFAHPLMRHHPGAAFVFPLGQSFAAEKLGDLIDLPLSALTPENAGLDAAVHHETPLELPNARAVGRFFDKVLERARREGGFT